MVIQHESGRPFKFEMCPHTGYTKTGNLAIKQNMRFNPHSTQKVKAVNSQRLDNSGLVTFIIKYQGKNTEFNALVSAFMDNEILLSWRVLQDLGVIDNTFKMSETTQSELQRPPR